MRVRKIKAFYEKNREAVPPCLAIHFSAVGGLKDVCVWKGRVIKCRSSTVIGTENRENQKFEKLDSKAH